MEYKGHILQEVIRRVFLENRRKRGLTQDRLSSLSNITRQFISQVEGGKRQPSISTLSALAKAYDKSLSDIFNEIDRLYSIIDTDNFIIGSDHSIAAENNKKTSAYIRDVKQKTPQ